MCLPFTCPCNRQRSCARGCHQGGERTSVKYPVLTPASSPCMEGQGSARFSGRLQARLVQVEQQYPRLSARHRLIMPIYKLSQALVFPPVEEAEDGVLAVGGDLRPERLLLAYRMGIFPWYHEGIPIIWHSPDPRCVLRLEALHVSRSLKKTMRQGIYSVTFDTAFTQVIRACKKAPRPGQEGTWITRDMESAYTDLHKRGYAHSVECWVDGQLVGGLYGVSLGRMFFGESMFSKQPDASKVALCALVERLREWDFALVDCQVANHHTLNMGAEEWPRWKYITVLRAGLDAPSRVGSWTGSTHASP